MHAYLSLTDVSFNDFARHVERVTREVKEAATAPAEKYKRPMIYLPSSEGSKQDLAKGIMRKDRVEKGLVCVLTAVEPCTSVDLHRNSDIRKLLFGEAKTLEEEKRQSARISRRLRMLRAHGLIKKVPHTHRYHVTEKGRAIISALMATRNADANQLTKLAA